MRYCDDKQPAYRAVVKAETNRYNQVSKRVEKSVGLDYIGPFSRIGNAKAAITKERNNHTGFIDGWVEVTPNEWSRVD